MKNFSTAIFLLLFLSPLFSSPPAVIRENFEWKPEPAVFFIGGERYEQWRFEGAVISDEHPSLPFLIRQFPLDGFGSLTVELIEARYEPFDKQASPDDGLLTEQLVFQTTVYKHRNRYYGKLTFVPIVKRGAGFERLLEVQIRIIHHPQPLASFRGPRNTENSVLKDGDIYKISTDKNGIYKITYDFLKSDLAIDIDNIDPRDIKLYGNGSGMLATYPGEGRIDDLAENHIEIVGEADGKFDPGDYILFYGGGPDEWVFDEENGEFNMWKNIYDDRNYYFLKISPEDGERIKNKPSLDNTAHTANAFDDYARFEQDKANLLHDWIKAQGSGQKWYGDHFKVLREYQYNNVFLFPNLITSSPAKLKAEMALRYTQRTKFSLDINDQEFFSDLASRVSVCSGSNDNIIDYAKIAKLNASVLLANDNIDIKVNYPNSGSCSEGWLDFIQLNVRRNLVMSGDQMAFRDIESLGFSSTTFQLNNAHGNIAVWDITDPLQPKLQESRLSGSLLSFGTTTESLKEFVAFNRNEDFLSPGAIGKIENQNLHAIDEVDLLIVYPLDFESEVQRFADHRANYSGLSVAIVRIDQVYNEFSSGSQDPTAIRDLAKMIYERSERFKYLCLFGDGSFDYKEVYGLGNNFVPVYERESLNPIFSFPTDDYFGILEGSNPNDALNGDLNIALGRLPVKTPDEARFAVDKIINYDTNPKTMGDWRNRLTFVGDDEDGYIHTGDADQIANRIGQDLKSLNINKIYLDAFPQVSTPGGDRFPSVTEAINKDIFKGVLAITYLGHGGSKGLAQERILNISDILAWENRDRLTLFVTATCSFTGYDDAGFTTAGEEVFLNKKGGAIALFTTTRAVYASQNADLTEIALKKLFERPDNRVPTIGEVMQNAKNSFSGGGIITNSRKFTLIGDPSLKLAIPEYYVITTRIDDHDLSDGLPDTLRALQKVTIEGIVQDENGQLLSNFNGVIFPTIFDKKVTVSTLGQDAGSPVRDFSLQKNIIFKGRATVENGKFKFTFVVPKDINYQIGNGKISYYASDQGQMKDAAGSYENIIIGGTDPNALADEQGPKVDIFLNTEGFSFGGITDENPTLLVKLEDENGINVVGNSIGHDLEGVLDQNTQNSFLLNDFYESELDDYTRGEARFPLSKLEEGRHEIRVKAWDIANNSAEGYTEFIVASSAALALEHVLNYPNPFTDFTCFQFDHNMTNQELEVLIQIFTVSGRLVKTIEQLVFSDGAIRRDNCIEWDGKDDYGDQLARGVYLYKVKVRTFGGGNVTLSGESEFEKLVILK